MPAKEILAALQELEAAGGGSSWRAVGRSHAYARAYCPGGRDGCPPLTVYGTPKVPEHEAEKTSSVEALYARGRGAVMNMYWFDIEVVGPVNDEHIEALGDRLASVSGIDATVQADHRGGTVMFSREADDAVQAIVSAIGDVEAAGIVVSAVTEDLVTVEDIAERARVTATAVRYWIAGTRGPGEFPQPRVVRQRSQLYSWADVSAWLASAKLGQVDHVAAETAQACAIVRDALAVRRGIRELPRHERPLITGLVAA